MKYDKEFDVFSKNLRTFREKNKLSKIEMARKLHITVRTLNILENGQIPPRIPIDIFFYFAKLCNVPVSAVFKTFQM